MWIKCAYYVIVGKVFDAAGDELWIRITFVTKGKE